MTITTVNSSRLPRLAPLAAAVMAMLSSPALAAWDVVPALMLRETWSDNVALQAEPLAQSQLISELTPSLAINHRSPRLTLTSMFKLQHYEFSNEQVSGTSRNQREASAAAQATLIDEFLFFNAAGSRNQRSISPFGVINPDAGYATQNRAPVTAYSISPYIMRQFGGTANMQLRYTKDSVDAQTSGVGNSKGDSLLFNLSSGRSFRTFGWGINFHRQDLDDARAQSISSQTALASLRYRATGTLNLTATGGYDKYDYSSLGGVTEGASWTAGFIWTPSPRTSLEASGGKRYIGTTKTLRAVHRSRRTVWNISYNDAVTNSRSNFLIPATLDTAALLDRLFQADIADPLQRQLAVAEYMRRTGLPPTLADSINYFSNRFFLQKSFNGSVALKGARSALVLTAYRTRRDGLSVRESDSELLGNNSSTVNDNTSQYGGSVSLSYSLSPRTTLLAIADSYRSQSLSANLNASNRAFRLTANRRIGKHLASRLELRHIKGTTIFLNNQPYRENAITASLTYTR